MTDLTNVITATNLCVSRNGRLLTDPLSFTVAKGQYCQITGPNGSGKSTLLRQLAGLVLPETGHILVQDTHCTPHEIAMRLTISYLGHADALHRDLTGYENFELLTGLERTDLVQLPLYERLVAHYSAGQRQKLLLHMLSDEADLWLLDEPSASLDEANCHYLEERIAGFLALGGAVIATTHTPLAQSLVTKTITLDITNHDGGA
ncbi:MAG: heme ABC exporter ATP-binding protein CcmA [Candidatus Puniceispirillaceae bacterium]